MNNEELKRELATLNKMVGFKPNKREVSEDGALLLDPNNPRDVDWFADDYY